MVTNCRYKGAIIDIAYSLPDRVLNNDNLKEQFPAWNVDITSEKVGVTERRIAKKSETALDLALKASDQLLNRHPEFQSKIDAILFCTQTPDYVMPSNAFLVHNHLKLPHNVLAFDYNLACSGYVYGLFLASSLMKTDLVKNVLLLTGDTYSKIIDERDRATRMLFGDGASATWLSSEDKYCKNAIVKRFLDFDFGTQGSGWDKFIVPTGGSRVSKNDANTIPASDKIKMDGIQVLNFAKRVVVPHMENLIKKNNLEKCDIDQFLVHQASKLALDTVRKRLSIREEKLYSNMNKIGNTVSSSLPILLKDYLMGINHNKTQKLFITGFGVGYSWGSVLVDT